MSPGARGLALPAFLGRQALALLTQIGGLALLARDLGRAARPESGGLDRVELLRHLYRMGVRSVPVVAATAAFTGGIMVLQAAPFVEQFGAKDFVGFFATFVTFRELGPLLIGLIFNGRVGANNTAELATMVVTEQVDGLRALAIDPVSYLVLPRVVAMTLTMVALVVLGDAVALLGALGVAHVLLDVTFAQFLDSALSRLESWDLLVGLLKALLFGVGIALASCFYGLRVRGGAPGVGRAVNASVVASAAGIFITDYLSTFLLP
ncbi:MAG: ABC transporter permease [Myxococcota bacterium]